MNGRAAVNVGQGKPIELREYRVPDPEPGAIVVKMRQAGMCGSDLHSWRGDGTPLAASTDGRPCGHEGMGQVQALGAGVNTDFLDQPLHEGDRVVFSAVFSCGRCLACLNGDHNLCPRMTLRYEPPAGHAPYFVGTFADYVYLPPNHAVFKVPNQLTDDEVVSLNCAMGTVFQGLESAALRQGQTVVVLGAGGLGLYATAFAPDFGAGQVIVVDGQPARLDLAKALGATAVIDINELPPAGRIERVRELTAGRGADVVLELVGAGELVQQGLDMLARGGTFVEIGNIVRGRQASLEPQTMLWGKRIIGSAMYQPGLMPRMLDFLVRTHDRLPLHKVISHHFPLADINRAYAECEWTGRTTPVIRGAVVP